MSIIRYGELGAPNSAGVLLFVGLDTHGCVVLNSEAPLSTYLPPPPKTPSVLDLAIVSAALSSFYTFKVDEDPRGSDHLPVYVAISLKINFINAFSYKIKIPNAGYMFLILSSPSLSPPISSKPPLPVLLQILL